tara:strand:+ start:75 stop:563 length:489 start_codon:yes stop_codon:yes gene_type:complete
MEKNILLDSLLSWRETLVAIMFAGLGLYWILNSYGTLYFFGYGVLIIGIILAYVGYQRTSFKIKETGGGIVEFAEGQISYFGLETGAIFSIDDIEGLVIDKSNNSSKWIIEITSGSNVEIPTNVVGNEVLFDVFNSLDGFQIQKMLEALSSSRCDSTVLWQK